jgi:hypothetical protein
MPDKVLDFRNIQYDSKLEGYRSEISAERLSGGPKQGTETVFEWERHSKGVDNYWGDPITGPE